MLDHRRDPGVAHHGRTQLAEGVAFLAAERDEAQTDSRTQQTDRTLRRKIHPLGQGLRGLRTLGQDLEELQAHAGKQDLRVDEPGDDVEQLARAFLSDGAGQGKDRGPTLKTGARQ